ncbi:hypothetical protein PR048_001206 [Dryococelus australis]|uniref:Uncharacterized protein n=1 Tax=Dryococelus australis TaxID=614101 RepID=A0ABQ9IHP7_9NEOP|nr:hypothetical protein PR048_001206 [Dryococelus australis]
MDNSPAQSTVESLSNTGIVFLPSNYSPLDQVIIQQLMLKFTEKLVQSSILLLGLEWLYENWDVQRIRKI